MDDLTGFKQPAEKDWRENIYTGKNMPSENAQRELRDKTREKGEWRFIGGGLLLILFPISIIAAIAAVLSLFFT